MQDPIEEFLKEEQAKKLADNTKRKRRMVMEWLDEWAEKDVREFERGDIRDFLTWLQDGGHRDDSHKPSDGTVSNYMSQVTALFEFLVEEGEIDEDDNPRDKIQYDDYITYKTTEMKKALRDGNKGYVALKDDEPIDLIANAPEPKKRNALMMLLQLETGPRVGELVNVRWKEDVDLEEQTITYETLKKEDKEWRTLEFSFEVKSRIDEWLNQGYRDRFKSAQNSPYLFVSRQAPKVSENRYNQIVKEAAENAGIQRKGPKDSNGNQAWKVRSHVLRHTYAENMVNNGCDISHLADLMGHQSIQTTRKYLDHDEAALRDAQREYRPDYRGLS